MHRSIFTMAFLTAGLVLAGCLGEDGDAEHIGVAMDGVGSFPGNNHYLGTDFEGNLYGLLSAAQADWPTC